MATFINTTTTLTQALRDIYSADLVIGAEPQFLFQQFTQRWPEPGAQNGQTVYKTIYYKQRPELAPLAETTDVDPRGMAAYQISATVYEYGMAIDMSEKLRRLAYQDVVGQRVRGVGYSEGITLDTMARNVYYSSANKWYGGNATSRATIDTADIFSVDIIRKMTRNLDRRGANRWENAAYMGVIHPDVIFDIQNDAKWKDPAMYADASRIWRGEVGMMYGMRFVSTTRAKLPNAGATSWIGVLTGAVNKGGKTFVVTPTVPHVIGGLSAGMELTIGGTGGNVAGAEEMVIASVNAGTSTVTAEEPFYFDHAAGDEVKDGTDIYPVVAFGRGVEGEPPVAWPVALEPEPRFGPPTDRLQRLNSVGWYGIFGYANQIPWSIEVVECGASV